MFVLKIISSILIGIMLFLMLITGIAKHKSLSASEVVTYIYIVITYVLSLICMWA